MQRRRHPHTPRWHGLAAGRTQVGRLAGGSAPAGVREGEWGRCCPPQQQQAGVRPAACRGSAAPLGPVLLGGALGPMFPPPHIRLQSACPLPLQEASGAVCHQAASREPALEEAQVGAQHSWGRLLRWAGGASWSRQLHHAAAQSGGDGRGDGFGSGTRLCRAAPSLPHPSCPAVLVHRVSARHACGLRCAATLACRAVAGGAAFAGPQQLLQCALRPDFARVPASPV